MKTIVLAIAAALTFAACGGGGSRAGNDALFDDGPGKDTTEVEAPTSTPDGEGTAEPKTAKGGGDLPSVEVVNVATGQEFDFASLVPAERPLLVWFWAPH